MIKVTHLSKQYGPLWALRDVDLSIEKGDMFGLIGPNGAGKTTLIKIAATLLRPTGGTITVDGLPVMSRGHDVRKLIGYLPVDFGVYEEMRVTEYLEFFGASYGIRGAGLRATVDSVLELTDLTTKRDSMIFTLSQGMKQRLGLARVLVHDPKVLLLDEPASGLDPRARIELRALLKELQNMGKTILISSHILADLAELCNKIGLIEKGKLLYAGGLKEALERVVRGNVFVVEVAEDQDAARALLAKQDFVLQVAAQDGQLLVHLRPEFNHPDHALPELLIRSGFKLKCFKPAEVTLEDAFLKLTKGEVS
jgi:ABC-2 type transport system ATP-binding protein